MGKLESVFKLEINRLARRETRRAVLPIKDELKKLKARSLELRTLVLKMKTELEAARAKARMTSSHEAVSQGKVRHRLSPRLIARLRKKLGVSQQKFAKLVGASLPSVANWEGGKTTPSDEMRTKILSLRGLKKRDVLNMQKAGVV